MATAPVQATPDRRNDAFVRRWLPPFALLGVGALAYCNIFSAPFIFDDPTSANDLRVRSLWPPWRFVVGTTRPVTDLTFALNYELGSLNVGGYHAFNLAVHLTAALVLFGCIRRTLITPALDTRYRSVAEWMALVIALVWLVHPLQTQSVTYTSQRAESLMGLFYLLTLYCVIRAAASTRSTLWNLAAIAACAVGMATKPVMITAPIVVLLYDRVFLAGSWRRAWRQRRWVHLGLAATWIIAILILSGPHESAATAGFGMRDLTPLAYARTQPGVVLHYLALVFWPHHLVLDYGWPVATNANVIIGPVLVLLGLVVLTVWAFRRHEELAFLGAAFFLILAPSSSFIPIADLAFEHRMYLPLAPLVTLIVIGADILLRQLHSAAGRQLGVILSVLVVSVLSLRTILRNQDYLSPVAMWTSVVDQRPDNVRAHNNLGDVLFRAGDVDNAVPHYIEALRLNPNYADAHNNLGVALARQGDYPEAVEHYRAAVRIKPDYAEAHNNLGVALAKGGQYDDAITHYREAVRLKPDYVEAHSNLGNVLLARGQNREALSEFQKALSVQPNHAEVHSNMGRALAAEGRYGAAIEHYTEALRLKPELAENHHNLGSAFFAQGNFERAAEEFKTALRLNPNLAVSRQNLALALQRLRMKRGGG